MRRDRFYEEDGKERKRSEHARRAREKDDALAEIETHAIKRN
jgi:hypothetical protein